MTRKMKERETKWIFDGFQQKFPTKNKELGGILYNLVYIFSHRQHNPVLAFQIDNFTLLDHVIQHT
jgi:hypothetical protein